MVLSQTTFFVLYYQSTWQHGSDIVSYYKTLLTFANDFENAQGDMTKVWDSWTITKRGMYTEPHFWSYESRFSFSSSGSTSSVFGSAFSSDTSTVSASTT